MNTLYSKELTERVLSFCESLVPGTKPFYVDHTPIPGKPVKECFRIVPEHVIAHGGKQIIGWGIMGIPHVMLEAQFHTIWQSPEGRFIDLTPREISIDKILFLPDNKRRYEGHQVQSIIQTLGEHPESLSLISRIDKGDLSDAEEAAIQFRLWEISDEMRIRANREAQALDHLGEHTIGPSNG